MARKLIQKKKGSGGRKGKGRGKGRKKRRQSLSDEEDGEPKRKGRRRQAVEKVAEPVPEEPSKPLAPTRPSLRPTEPGFDALLQSFGVKDSDSEDEVQLEEGEEEEEQVSEEDAVAPHEAAPAEVDEAEEELDQEQIEEPAEKSAPLEADWPNYYPSFWADSPVSLAASGGSDPCPPNFSLPGLSRCEVRDRDVGLLVEQLRSIPDAGNTWSRCRLYPGLSQLFSQMLEKEELKLGPEEGALFLFLHAYLDVSFPMQTPLNSRAVRAVCMLHAADHMLKSWKEVLDHNAGIKAAGKAAADCVAGDQGFARARVLVLCPFRSVCYEMVQALLALCPRKQLENRKRFEEEFQSEEPVRVRDPSFWRSIFYGNNDDRFRVGIVLRRKTLRFYAPFAGSDVIFCSPLGLRQVTGVQGERDRDFDFLSSIELCIVDRADVLRMQNWEHVQQILEIVNRRPKSLATVDISRLRPAFADGRARAFRQTVVLSCGQSLDADALFRSAPHQAPQQLQVPKVSRRWGVLNEEEEDIEAGATMTLQLKAEVAPSGPDRSCRGWVRLARPPEGRPLQQALSMGVNRQFFLHVGCGSLSSRQDALFQAFESRYWRPLGFGLERLLVVAAEYLGFLRMRKFLRAEEASFASGCEYTKETAFVHAKLIFAKGTRRVLLTTERLLWHRRYKLKGAYYVLFYGPPETPEIYADVLAGVRAPSTCNSMCLFTRQDGYALERIVGAERACRMLTSEPGKVFAFS